MRNLLLLVFGSLLIWDSVTVEFDNSVIAKSTKQISFFIKREIDNQFAKIIIAAKREIKDQFANMITEIRRESISSADERGSEDSVFPGKSISEEETAEEVVIEEELQTLVNKLKVTDAVPTSRTLPIYPVEAVSREIEGRVVLKYDIAPDGSVINLRVSSANPSQILEAAALKAAKSWRYIPRMENQIPVFTYGVETLLKFELTDR